MISKIMQLQKGDALLDKPKVRRFNKRICLVIRGKTTSPST
ncbi:unnamed protein product [Amoebophrya sp. A25]|nr:unnamed protein product [Amoebophrya sp. A25]|eukprot:GSA25T00008061001.1